MKPGTKSRLVAGFSVALSLLACGSTTSSSKDDRLADASPPAVHGHTDEHDHEHEHEHSMGGSATDGGAQRDAGQGVCPRLASLCHTANVAAEFGVKLYRECHEVGHRGVATACAKKADECLAACLARVVDAGLDPEGAHQ